MAWRKRVIKYTICRAALISAGIFLLSAAPAVHAADIQEKKQPLHITSDSLEAFNEKRMVVFSGNAVAVRGDVVLRSDTLLLYYKEPANSKPSKETESIGKTGDLDRIEAKGHVSVTQGKRVATGDMAVFYQDSQKIVMTGNTVLREERNIVRGNKITLLMEENRGVVEAEKGKRVTAVIFPSEKKETKP